MRNIVIIAFLVFSFAGCKNDGSKSNTKDGELTWLTMKSRQANWASQSNEKNFW
jgi:hypothetical protein